MSHPAPGLRRPLLLGASAVAAYLVVAVVTLGGGASVRPLFDSFTPPPPYRWVDPPKELAAGNVKPPPTVVDVPLAAEGSALRGIATDDGQFVLNLPDGAIVARDTETSVKVEVAPVGPASLGPLPPGLRADGNAYRASMAYQPSSQPVATLAKPGSLVMTVPEAGDAVLYSADGRTWTTLTTQNLGGPVNPGANFDQPGYYLGATRAPVPEASGGSSGLGDRVVAVAVITVVVALGLWFLPALARRVRRS